MDEYDQIFIYATDEMIDNATFIATFAEKFKLTSFKPFQIDTIKAVLDGKDTLVIYRTGSGKSLFSISASLLRAKSNCHYSYNQLNARPSVNVNDHGHTCYISRFSSV